MISSRVYGTTSEGFKFFGFATPAAGPSSIHLRTLQKLKTTGRLTCPRFLYQTELEILWVDDTTVAVRRLPFTPPLRPHLSKR
jgi:hypothetical protein